MTTSLHRLLENSIIASYIEVTEIGNEIPFDSTRIFNLNSLKKIEVSMIVTEVDPGSYLFNPQRSHSTLQGRSYYICTEQIDLSRRTSKDVRDPSNTSWSNLELEIHPKCNRWELWLRDTSGLLYIHPTVPAETTLTF
jgi:hypothetical protein